MNQEIKKEWVTALRSGEYKQGKNRLRKKTDEFCCLGVLCDLYIKKHNINWEEYEYNIDFYKFLDTSTILPKQVQDWSELKTSSVEGIKIPDKDSEILVSMTNLTSLNDNGFTFNEIADLIEQQL